MRNPVPPSLKEFSEKEEAESNESPLETSLWDDSFLRFGVAFDLSFDSCKIRGKDGSDALLMRRLF
jgi:hypothetical protein